MKVISIFGNTGEGKSYTLNHTFYGGQEIFHTSQAQAACTIGVWAAYNKNLNIVTIDTEGLLGFTANANQRTRLLLKVNSSFNVLRDFQPMTICGKGFGIRSEISNVFIHRYLQYQT